MHPGGGWIYARKSFTLNVDQYINGRDVVGVVPPSWPSLQSLKVVSFAATKWRNKEK